MKPLLTRASGICALIFAVLFAYIEPGLAHGWLHRHHCKCYTHVAYIADVEPAPFSTACRVGWWQTLRYGHVRPRWGAWCR
jgi:hypothetical protein